MQTFRYFPPGSEEQKAFFLQFVGALLGLALVAVLCFQADDETVKGVLLGAGAGVIWLLGRAAWSLEKKAQRAQNAELSIDEEGLHITDAKRNTQLVRWEVITDLGVTGGRLTVAWPGGKFAVGARELENGMTLVREVMKRQTSHGEVNGGSPPPSSFIPLEPR